MMYCFICRLSIIADTCSTCILGHHLIAQNEISHHPLYYLDHHLSDNYTILNLLGGNLGVGRKNVQK